MARKTNIFHLFSGKMTKSISIAVIVLVLWFSNVNLYAQNDMVISYDEETEVLTIDNQLGVVKFKTEDMPNTLREAVMRATADKGIVGTGSLPINGICKEELDDCREVVFY